MVWFERWPALVAGLMVGALCLSPAPARALQILSPADGSLLSPGTRVVIKGGDSPALDGVVIDINGEQTDLIEIGAADYRRRYQDFIFLEVEFVPGRNVLVVDGYAGGKRVAQAKAQAYLAGEFESPPAAFIAKPFHLAEREALCTGCHHQLEPTARELANPNPLENPCGTCHMGMLNRKHVHGPAGVFDCTVCHDPKSRPAKYAVADGEGRFCIDCHQDKFDDYRKASFIHGPVEVGACLACHDPHASDTAAQIRGTINASCGRCHESVMKSKVHVVQSVTGGSHPLEGPRSPLDPSKPYHCASCHDPHGAKIKGLLRGEQGGMAFCMLCHKK